MGKTVLKAGWCRAFTRGEPILGVPTNRPTAIYYLAADRPWEPTYAAAFAAAGLSDIARYCLMDPASGYDPRTLHAGKQTAFQFFAACLDRMAPLPGSLVFVDPMAPLFIQGDQNNARNVALSLHWIRRCGQAHQITLICDANVTKLKADEDFKRPQDRISGSGAFLAYSDTVFNFTDDGTDEHIRTLTWQPRRAPAGQLQLVFDPDTLLFVPYEGLQDSGTTRQNDRPTRVLDLIPEEGISAGDLWERVKETLNISQKTFYRDLMTLFGRQLIERDSFGHYQRRKPS